MPFIARTAELNRGAQLRVDRRKASNTAAIARYRNAEAAYQRERGVWRRCAWACEAGDDGRAIPLKPGGR